MVALLVCGAIAHVALQLKEPKQQALDLVQNRLVYNGMS